MASILDLLKGLTGCSVTQRIKQVKQPRGGYINPREMETIELGEGADSLNPDENVHASLVGLAVDYLTRFELGSPAEEAFHISLLGAKLIKETTYSEVLNKKLKVMDLTAITLCMEENIPIIIFNINKPGMLKEALITDDIGSIVK